MIIVGYGWGDRIMPTKKEIQARFAEYFPQLANVRLSARFTLLGSSEPFMGLQRLHTVAYILCLNQTDNVVVPIMSEVATWDDIKALLRSKGYWGGPLYNVVIIEVVYIDHAVKQEKTSYHLRDYW